MPGENAKTQYCTNEKYVIAFEYWAQQLIGLSNRLDELDRLTLGRIKALRRRLDKSLKNCKIVIRRLQVLDPNGTKSHHQPYLGDPVHYRFLYRYKMEVTKTIEYVEQLLEKKKRKIVELE